MANSTSSLPCRVATIPASICVSHYRITASLKRSRETQKAQTDPVWAFLLIPRRERSALVSDQRNFRRHFALGTLPDPEHDVLTFTKLADIAAPQSFHMHEHVGCAGASRNESVSLRAIEPFDHSFEWRPTGFGDIARR